MEAANEKLFIRENGLRPDVGKALVWYTNGKTHPTSEGINEAVAALKARPLVRPQMKGEAGETAGYLLFSKSSVVPYICLSSYYFKGLT